jgi:hypothetical protein
MFNDFKVIISGSAEPDIENNGAGFNLPGFDWLDSFAGIYPTVHDTHSSNETSTANTIDFLQIRGEGFAKVGHPEWGYTTFLAALKKSGMADTLATGGPYLVFAPTDEAFAALPMGQLDALMTDPKSLGDLLRGHLVEGYLPYGTLGLPGAGFDRTLTNMRGEQLKISGDDSGFEKFGRQLHTYPASSPISYIIASP